jgi:peptide deformylase
MNLKIVPLQEIPRGLDCQCDHLPELYKLGLLMEVIYERESGIGLSAVQVGISKRFYIINYNQIKKDNGYRFFINCNYEKISDEEVSGLEGCLSLRKEDGSIRYFLVKRPKKIRINGKELSIESGELTLKDIFLECEGIEAVVHMHEIDHGFGILISDIGAEHVIWR